MFEITTGFHPAEKYWTIEDAEAEAAQLTIQWGVTVHILRSYRGFTKKTYLGFIAPTGV